MKLIIGLGNPGKKYAGNRHNVGEMFVEYLREEERRSSRGEIPSQSEGRWGDGVEPGRDAELRRGTMKRRRGGVEERKWRLEKLEEFMNDSGKGVRKLRDFYKLTSESIVIVHDDLDLKFGENKLQFGKGPYGHNGLLSIEEELGTKDFWRLRIGVDNRDPENRTPGVEYTLHDFTSDELKSLKEIFSKATNVLINILRS